MQGKEVQEGEVEVEVEGRRGKWRKEKWRDKWREGGRRGGE